MLGGMRLLLALALVASAGTARAEDLSITKDSPLAGLPAVSSDGAWFARPVRVQPGGCASQQSYVEIGQVAEAGRETKGTLYLVRDACGTAAVDKNIEQVNAALRGKGFRSTGTLQVKSVPAEIETGAGTVKVASSGKNKVSVAVVGSQTDRWSVTLDGALIEVRGWYAGKNGRGAPYIALLVAAAASDTGAKGRERWVDFWPIGKRPTVGEGDTPVDVATRFVEALRKQDTTALLATLSAPFWKVGLTPVSGDAGRRCKRRQSTRSDSGLRAIASCMSSAGLLYGKFTTADAIAEIDMSEFPDELRKHRRKVARLVKGEHKLVRFHVNENGYYIHLVLVLDPDTNYQTVDAVLESIDVEE